MKLYCVVFLAAGIFFPIRLVGGIKFTLVVKGKEIATFEARINEANLQGSISNILITRVSFVANVEDDEKTFTKDLKRKVKSKEVILKFTYKDNMNNALVVHFKEYTSGYTFRFNFQIPPYPVIAVYNDKLSKKKFSGYFKVSESQLLFRKTSKGLNKLKAGTIWTIIGAGFEVETTVKFLELEPAEDCVIVAIGRHIIFKFASMELSGYINQVVNKADIYVKIEDAFDIEQEFKIPNIGQYSFDGLPEQVNAIIPFSAVKVKGTDSHQCYEVDFIQAITKFSPKKVKEIHSPNETKEKVILYFGKIRCFGFLSGELFETYAETNFYTHFHQAVWENVFWMYRDSTGKEKKIIISFRSLERLECKDLNYVYIRTSFQPVVQVQTAKCGRFDGVMLSDREVVVYVDDQRLNEFADNLTSPSDWTLLLDGNRNVTMTKPYVNPGKQIVTVTDKKTDESYTKYSIKWD